MKEGADEKAERLKELITERGNHVNHESAETDCEADAGENYNQRTENGKRLIFAGAGQKDVGCQRRKAGTDTACDSGDTTGKNRNDFGKNSGTRHSFKPPC